VPLVWTGDPLEAGPADWCGVHLEPMHVASVALGTRGYFRDEFTDPRCNAVACVCAELRADGFYPSPELVVNILGRLGLYGPGCRNWVARILHGIPMPKSGRRS
jgi:hypothetical protein